jgi:hypothetical protein
MIKKKKKNPFFKFFLPNYLKNYLKKYHSFIEKSFFIQKKNKK